MPVYRDRSFSKPAHDYHELVGNKYWDESGSSFSAAYHDRISTDIGCHRTYSSHSWVFDNWSNRSESSIQDYDNKELRPFSPVEHVRQVAAKPSCTIEGYTTSWPYNNFNSYVGCTTLGISDYPVLTGEISWAPLITELAVQVRDRLTAQSLVVVTAVELAKTLRMIRNPFGLLKPNWRARAGLRTAAQLARINAGLWLEWKYGWKSLYADIKSFAKSYCQYQTACIQNSLGVEQDRFSKRSFQMVQNPFTTGDMDFSELKALAAWAGNLDDWPSKPSYYSIGTNGVTVEARVGCKVADAAHKQFSRMEALRKTLGCTASALLPTLWELIPYSFVVDWFVNTQTIMNLPAINKMLRQTKTGSLGYSIKQRMTYDVAWLHTAAPIWDSYTPWSPYGLTPSDVGSQSYKLGKGIHSIYVREPNLPEMSLSDFFSPDLTFSQGLSGTALIIQRLTQ